jgi:hypothetical protein
MGTENGSVWVYLIAKCGDITMFNMAKKYGQRLSDASQKRPDCFASAKSLSLDSLARLESKFCEGAEIRSDLFVTSERYSMYVTWNHQDTNFSLPLKQVDKFTIFFERIYGWQLHIADLCLNGGYDHNGINQLSPIPHSAFAAMQIMLAYFEMIAKYEDGFIPKNPKHGESAKFFKLGVKSLFPNCVNIAKPTSIRF